jgi:ribonuclease HI
MRDKLHLLAEQSEEQSLEEMTAALNQLSQTADMALQASRTAKESKTECDVHGMTVQQLKEALRVKELPTRGLKADLVARLSRSQTGVPTGVGSRFTSIADEDWWGGDEDLRELVDATSQNYAGSGPQSGIFTDGGASPNPGAGGWAAVCVENGRCVWVSFGDELLTTNNRMELKAMVAALKYLAQKKRANKPASPTTTTTKVYSDSALVVNTLTKWASGWEAKGWVKSNKKPPLNLDLVREAHRLHQDQAASTSLKWIKAHDGSTWNEVADTLATLARDRAV